MPGVTTKRFAVRCSLDKLGFSWRSNNTITACLERFLAAMKSKLLQRTLESKVSNILHVQAGETVTDNSFRRCRLWLQPPPQ